MCGLFFGIDVADGRAALARVSHRGPDHLSYHEEIVAGHRLSIGHARLSIIDVSDASDQPMAERADDARHQLVFNGAIYNFRELRAELQSAGVVFRSDGDTEVLLQALIHWGEDALPRLRGMFSFVWLDRDAGTVLAARDRFGIKPLYYVRTPDGGLAFGSEIKQLLPYASRRMNHRAAFDFLQGGLTDHREETFFEGIRQVRGGQLARIALGSGERPLDISRWWHTSRIESVSLSSEAAAEQFGTLFEQSIRRHLISDVSVGSCLSGGLDSSSIVSVATPHMPHLRTFTVEFPGTTVDESRYARDVADAAGATYTAVRPDMGGMWRDLDAILHAQDEPFGSSSLYAQWSVFAAARAHGTTVMLDGQGADELLAGYHANYLYAMAAAASKGRLLQLRALVNGYRSLGHDSRPVLRQALVIAAAHGPARGMMDRRRARGRAGAVQNHWLNAPAFRDTFDAGDDDVLAAAIRR
jgi:asparagine synthase (glutamine-hydrolysing)